MEVFFNTIPGVQQIRQNQQSVSKKVFWRFVFVACALSTFIIALDRAKFYLDEPFNYIYTYKLHDVYLFPSITVCPSPGFDLDIMTRKLNRMARFSRNFNVNDSLNNKSSIYEFLPDFTIDDIWRNAAESMSDIMIRCYFTGNKNCSDPSLWVSQWTVIGPCYTITISENISPYGDVILVLRLNDSWCPPNLCPNVNDQPKKWKILLHNWEEDITYKIFTHAHVVPPGMTVNVLFEKTNHEYNNISRRPCQPFDDFNACEIQCMDKELMRNSQCRLPFMTSVLDRPLCETPSDFEAMYPIPFQYRHDRSACECHRPCTLSTYDNFFDSSVTNEPGVTKLMFRPTDSYGRTTTSQQFSYGFIKLLCDIGALLGFHMGISLLTLIELLEYIFDRITHRMNVTSKVIVSKIKKPKSQYLK